MKNFTIFVSILFAISIKLAAQDTKDIPKYFGETFRIDSVETLLLTVQYNSDLYSGKFTFDDYYGNIIFYNYKKNTKKRLFETDTYIRPFRRRDYYRYNFSESNKLPDRITSYNVCYTKLLRSQMWRETVEEIAKEYRNNFV